MSRRLFALGSVSRIPSLNLGCLLPFFEGFLFKDKKRVPATKAMFFGTTPLCPFVWFPNKRVPNEFLSMATQVHLGRSREQPAVAAPALARREPRPVVPYLALALWTRTLLDRPPLCEQLCVIPGLYQTLVEFCAVPCCRIRIMLGELHPCEYSVRLC